MMYRRHIARAAALLALLLAGGCVTINAAVGINAPASIGDVAPDTKTTTVSPTLDLSIPF